MPEVVMNEVETRREERGSRGEGGGVDNDGMYV
jgi:hypothetical protein